MTQIAMRSNYWQSWNVFVCDAACDETQIVFLSVWASENCNMTSKCETAKGTTLACHCMTDWWTKDLFGEIIAVKRVCGEMWLKLCFHIALEMSDHIDLNCRRVPRWFDWRNKLSLIAKNCNFDALNTCACRKMQKTINVVACYWDTGYWLSCLVVALVKPPCSVE